MTFRICKVSLTKKKYIYSFILSFKNHVFNARGWSVRPKHVARIAKINKIYFA